MNENGYVVNVALKDIEPVNNLLNGLANLIDQIENSTYKDEDGKELKDNPVYNELIGVISGLKNYK
ncbi:hypothetical protein [Clostridium sp. HBUAS56017]|uniref:hypothetical protein n=1 Tax=Clostridium sp. HBUAS56017 TaxID=2571128 RepID=UPI0011784D39|nr:hypothetical protein [Clostridium sp. HBUAS56017]